MDKNKSDKRKQQIDWHSGFAGGLGLSFQHYRTSIDIEREVPLTKEPPRIDFIVIKKLDDIIIDNSVGKSFRKYNIIEFKNPSDELSIDTVWKTFGYAGFYKGSADHVNDIPEEELTITIFRTSFPRKLFKYWKDKNRQIETVAPGVYHLKGLVDIPLQIVVSKELCDDDFRALRIMMPHADENEVRRFLEDARKYTEPADKQDADAVLQVSALANKDTYNRLKEDKEMCDALKELMKDELKDSYNNGYDSGYDIGAKEEHEKNISEINALKAEIDRLQKLIESTP